jgi:predicted outer membrane repeat protein
MARHSTQQLRWIVNVLLAGFAAFIFVSATSAAGPPTCRVVNETQRRHFPPDTGQSLSEAIAAAAPDDELTITGTCTGTYTLDKNLSLTGLVTRRYPTPTLDGGQAGSTLTVEGGVTATLTNLTLSGGTGTAPPFISQFSGGGLYNGGTVTLVHVNVVGNNAFGGNGGGIFNGGTIVLESQSVVSGNSSRRGGGIYNGGTATVRGSSIVTGNTADEGGGIYDSGTLSIDGSSITGNSASGALARGGGGIFKVQTSSNQIATLTSATISNNSVANQGAGIHNGGTMVIQSSTVSGNTARGGGGGIYNVGTLTLTASTLRQNMGGLGGGLRSGNASATATVTASSMTGNTAFVNGGGVYLDAGTVSLQSASTVTGNTAFVSGGGFYNDGGVVNLGDTTVSGNTPDDCVGVAGC